MSQPYPRAGVSVAVFRESKVLLIRRGKAPYEGCWSLPGGAIQLGETAIEAAKRELGEETGLLASTLTLGDVADAIVKNRGGTVEAHYTIAVFTTNEVSGELRAAADASAAGWFNADERAALSKTPGLELTLEHARLALQRGGR